MTGSEGESSEAEPDWSLARRDAAAFLGLSGEYDATDLKRAYNRLLRRYKPEKAPDEFQIIRAAYEQLDRSLRYGGQTAQDASGWSRTEAEATSYDPSAETSPRPAVVSIEERLESGELSLETAYEELRAKERKSPQDYFQLALLSDAVEPSSDDFFPTLAEGLRAWPDDAGLLTLARAYLGGQAPLETLPDKLAVCGEAVSTDTFYALTEAGWDRLLRERPFTEFERAFAACESKLETGGDPAITSKVAFYIHALSFALWEDESPWSQVALDFVETHFDQAPPHLSHHLDVLDLVREYVAVRKSFVVDSPLCERMDGLMRSAFVEGPAETDRAIVEFQLEALEDPARIRAAFPIVSDDHQLPAYALWAYVVSDVAARNASQDEGEIDLQFWVIRLQTFYNKLLLDSSWTELLWLSAEGFFTFSHAILKGGVLALACIGVFIGVFLACLLLAEWTEWESEGGVLLSALAGCAATAWGGIKGGKWWSRVVDSWFQRPVAAVSRRFAARAYRKLWRPKLFGFIEQTQLDYYSFRAILDHVINPAHARGRWILHHAQRDVGMAVYGLAQHFRV